ncbi:MAG: hypothetical protein UX12_C0011G0010 [Candidatus Collierbacteria bacterium GW2011_GWC1_45_47]|uniref:D-alanine--D-alanine ligase n=3 Tax=Candidatus Collieribacteriota TaxID=1752725 RepID=A0A0G1JRS0_9BACT|nr:MAG: D-alanine-D-alanine ligase [Candidatus Collierbacteria bacterium GW2011_GWA1_44_12]KKT46597.1 MAG: D-alanine-D-alanine ligase [Candidatus Collierbacteria bacterium GW2011_GWF2_44_15]KKU09468.1 MAG: hypothetical protein UX12_C0011G0010 [Candidatus Collierbacteria bacterium GW2011_GWC1_45_47]KKU27717.1 MAG: D-alanine-D-alanine ligase [Candidatus Collierbacteria bacterium GW2011_GWE1_46_18]
MVLYGGVSPEHEVAIISAVQAMNALKGEGFEVIPVYISKEGEWFMGGENYLKPDFYKDLEKVKSSGKQVILSANRGWGLMQKGLLGFAPVGVQIDVVFPVFHGSNGEDGTIQGLLELANLPYVFSGVLGGSAGMDKYVTKRVAEGLGMNVAPDKLVVREGWNESKLKTVLKEVKFPVFVKPATLGSTIGITRVEKPSELGDAIEVGFHYDDRVLVEDGIDLEKEVNISVLGNGPYEVSVTEQPVTKDKLLSFKDKYIASSSSKTQGMASAKRMIPAPITKEQQATIEKWSRNIFRAINGKGLARVDFIIDEKGKVYFNEINTIPGSLSFYLWERSGYPFGKLVTKLIQLAEESWEEKQKKVTVFESNILAGLGRLGVKGKA